MSAKHSTAGMVAIRSVFVMSLAAACSEADCNASPQGVVHEPSARTDRPEVDVALLPQRFTDITGLSVAYPADWELVQDGSSTSFVPADAPRTKEGPQEVYVVVFQGAGDASTAHDPELLAALEQQFAEALPEFQASPTQELGEGPDATALLAFSRTHPDRTTLIELRVKVCGDFVCGIFSAGREDLVQRRRSLATAVFDSLELRAPRRDPALVGSWTSSDSYTNVAAEFSMASGVTVALSRDGRFTRSSEIVGGPADVGIDSDGEAETGLWFAGDGRVLLMFDSGAVASWPYRFHEGQLVTGTKGSYRFWSR